MKCQTGNTVSGARFAECVAVVTGGASGIGRAIVRRLVAEGARVVVGDIADEGLAVLRTELGDKIATIHADVRHEAEVAALVKLATDRFGRLDAAFNVAGRGAGNPIVDLDEADWDDTVAVCLKGVFLSIKHEARAMSGRGGAIVNIASLNSHVPMWGGSAYTSAKAGVEMLTRNAALELAPLGIRVNAVSPGMTATPLTEAARAVPALAEAYFDRIPMRRWAEPEEIAAPALFLASSDASFVSGSNLFVDGAWETTGYPDMRPFFAAGG